MCVEHGRRKCPFYDVDAHKHTYREHKEMAPYTPGMTRYEDAFFAMEKQEKKTSPFALHAPHCESVSLHVCVRR